MSKNIFVFLTICCMILAINSPNMWIRTIGVLVAACCGLMTGLMNCKEL